MLKTTTGEFINPQYIKRFVQVNQGIQHIWLEGTPENTPHIVEKDTAGMIDAIDKANDGNAARLSELVNALSRRVTDLIQAINRMPSSIRMHY